MSSRHLTDDELSGLVLHVDEAPESDRHLRQCPACARRHDALSSLLGELTATADLETHNAFPAERLAEQRARLLSRLASDDRAARVLAFPEPAPDRRVFRPRPAMRWIAAAAAAGMAIGLGIGRFNRPTSLAVGTTSRVTLDQALQGTRGMAPARLVLSDDEFMGEIELAVDRPWHGLEPMHELTPP